MHFVSGIYFNLHRFFLFDGIGLWVFCHNNLFVDHKKSQKYQEWNRTNIPEVDDTIFGSFEQGVFCNSGLIELFILLLIINTFMEVLPLRSN